MILQDLDAAFLREVSASLSTPVQSLALHMAPGYREFFKAYLDLLSNLEIRDGPFALSEKELSTLYEMWCFIKLGSFAGGDSITLTHNNFTLHTPSRADNLPQ
jgi:uncharacterized protein